MGDFFEEFSRGFAQGRQQAMERKRLQQEQQDRELYREHLKAEMQRTKVQDLLHEKEMARQEDIQNFMMKQIQPGQILEGTTPTQVPTVPLTEAEGTTPASPPVASMQSPTATAPPMGGLMDRLMQIKAQTAPTSIQPAALPGIPSTEQGHPPMTIRGVTGPDTTMTPLTPSQQAAKSIQALIAQETVKHEVAKKFGPSQFHTVPEEGLGVITDAAGNVIQTFQGGHGKEEREQRQIEAANARAELAGRSRIAAAKIAAGGRATDEDREFTHFNAMLGQLDHLVRAKAFAQNKTDIFSIPGVSQPLSDADAQTAVATLDQQIQEKRNFLQNQFPDLWKKYGVAVPAPSSDGSLMMPSHGPTPAASTGTPSITPAEAIQELKRRGRI